MAITFQSLCKEIILTEGSDEKCLFCRTKYQFNDSIVKLPCGHRFHSEEVRGWINSNENCPLCREGLPLDSWAINVCIASKSQLPHLNKVWTIFTSTLNWIQLNRDIFEQNACPVETKDRVDQLLGSFKTVTAHPRRKSLIYKGIEKRENKVIVETASLISKPMALFLRDYFDCQEAQVNKWDTLFSYSEEDINKFKTVNQFIVAVLKMKAREDEPMVNFFFDHIVTFYNRRMNDIKLEDMMKNVSTSTGGHKLCKFIFMMADLDPKLANPVMSISNHVDRVARGIVNDPRFSQCCLELEKSYYLSYKVIYFTQSCTVRNYELVQMPADSFRRLLDYGSAHDNNSRFYRSLVTVDYICASTRLVAGAAISILSVSAWRWMS
ncbi:MAG: RING finger domain-containing protein [Rhabdochlamydiaceae bacterium]|nr:RING finger domain-containing protein [Candidatus Amphrikana amoebophyrae]